MAGREGTRRKKISVLHMLGTWEGKIDGCNCPSCKEYDEEQLAIGIAKAAAKANAKTSKTNKALPKKTVIKVKTTKVFMDKTKEKKLLSTKDLPKAFDAPKREIKGEKIVNHTSDNEMQKEIKDLSISGDINRPISDPTPENKNKITDDKEIYIKKEGPKSESNIDINFQNSTSKDSNEVNEVPKTYKHSSEKDISKSKNYVNDAQKEPVNIKQEPVEYFSDEDDFNRDEIESESSFSDSSPDNIKPNKRARKMGSVENIYAKPRMIFTGRGLVRKISPGAEKILKPKIRKTIKSSPVKVKQEPKELEYESNDMDQLHTALSVCSQNISVDDEFFNNIENDFNEEPKEVKMRKKAKFRMIKKVDSDGNKYVECNICFKMLKESSMKQHYKTHLGEKPHVCEVCHARFTRKGDVERHNRLVHKNQKPFKCRKCIRTFSDRKLLKLHLLNHDKNIYYACNTCGFKFGKREYYQNHVRYIHPLPDGSMPAYGDVDIDLAIEQLNEIEKEEKKERKEKDGKSKTPSESPILEEELEENIITDEVKDAEEGEETVAPRAEITLTEGFLGSPLKSIKENMDTDSESCVDPPLISNIKVENKNSEIKPSTMFNKNLSEADMTVSQGTLSFTQTISDPGCHDEDIVNRAIANAVSQATDAIEGLIESLQSMTGGNMCNNDIDLEEEEEEEEELIEEDLQGMLDFSCDIIPVAPEPPKPIEQPGEIHLDAVLGGKKQRFIIQLPLGTQCNLQTPEGMEMIVNIVNQLCSGKGELEGPIKVISH